MAATRRTRSTRARQDAETIRVTDPKSPLCDLEMNAKSMLSMSRIEPRVISTVVTICGKMVEIGICIRGSNVDAAISTIEMWINFSDGRSRIYKGPICHFARDVQLVLNNLRKCSTEACEQFGTSDSKCIREDPWFCTDCKYKRLIARAPSKADSCAICMEKMFGVEHSISILKCNHAFHIQCVGQLQKMVCPICRKRFTLDDVNNL
jgi:hypothetical protein